MATKNPETPSGKTSPKAERAERLAAQLRANLKKRKAQSRGRVKNDVSESRKNGESGQP